MKLIFCYKGDNCDAAVAGVPTAANTLLLLGPLLLLLGFRETLVVSVLLLPLLLPAVVAVSAVPGVPAVANIPFGVSKGPGVPAVVGVS
jgi:hypothetical protein